MSRRMGGTGNGYLITLKDVNGTAIGYKTVSAGRKLHIDNVNAPTVSGYDFVSCEPNNFFPTENTSVTLYYVPMTTPDRSRTVWDSYYNESSITTATLNTYSATSLNKLFWRCYNLTSVSRLNTSNATGTMGMFYRCENLLSVPMMDLSKSWGAAYLFYLCKKLTSIPPLDTGSVGSMYSMFEGCEQITTIPQLDTSEVYNMARMFASCISLTSVPQLNTSNVTDMYLMFYNCSKLTSIPWDIDMQKIGTTSGVPNCEHMLTGCTGLTSNVRLINVPSAFNLTAEFLGTSKFTVVNRI